MARLLIDQDLINREERLNTNYRYVSDDLNRIASFVGIGHSTAMIRRWFQSHRPKSPYTNIEAVLRVTHGAEKV